MTMLGYIAEKPLGYCQLTSIDTAVVINTVATTTLGGVTRVGIPVGTQLILITPETQAVRWRDDGTAPTATVGYPLPAGTEFRYTADNDGKTVLQFISQVAGAKLNLVFYRNGHYT